MSQYIFNFEGNIDFFDMNTAEIKLDLFRKIDNLTEPELEKMYRKYNTIRTRTMGISWWTIGQKSL